MRTNDGHEIENGSDIYVAYPSIDNIYKPIKVNMYDIRAHFKYWFLKKENCKIECDKLNKKEVNND